MRRLFWMGLGAVGAVVVGRKARTIVRSMPETVTDAVVTQVGRAGQRTSSAVRDAVEAFRVARAEREVDLVAALLVEPEGGTERRPRTPRGARTAHADSKRTDSEHVDRATAWDDDPWGPEDDEP